MALVAAQGGRNEVKRRLKVEDRQAVERAEPTARKAPSAVREKASSGRRILRQERSGKCRPPAH